MEITYSTYNITIVVCPHCKQIPIKSLIFAVPFKVKCDSSFQKINIMTVNMKSAFPSLHIIIQI